MRLVQRRRLIRRVVFLGAITAMLGLGSAQAATERIEWIDQFGTGGFDSSDDVATDPGFVYATGRVASGALPGQASAGGVDAFLRKYDPSGQVVWTRQFGTSGFDGFGHTAVTGVEVFAAGITTGVFPGQTQLGTVDVFLSRFAADGTPEMTRQIGTAGADFALSLAVDETNVYLLGMTTGVFPGQASAGGRDFFLARLTHDGDLVWVDQFGTSGDDPSIFTLGGLVADETGLYVGSSVGSSLPGQDGVAGSDGFIRKYDHDGNVIWTEQFGTACSDVLSSLTLQSDRLIATGATAGAITDPLSKRCTRPPEPQRDFGQPAHAFVQMRDLDGGIVWSREFEGQGVNDGGGFSLGIDITADESAIFVASEAVRTPGAQPQDPTCPQRGPQEDVQVRAYDFDGNELWTQFVGTTATDAPSGIAVNDFGVYVGGSTQCGLGGNAHAGSGDAFVLKVME